jgi:hypothetical protein
MKSDRLTLSSTKCVLSRGPAAFPPELRFGRRFRALTRDLGRAEKPSIGGQFNQAIAMKDNGGSKLRMGHRSLQNGLCLIDPSRIDRT